MGRGGRERERESRGGGGERERERDAYIPAQTPIKSILQKLYPNPTITQLLLALLLEVQHDLDYSNIMQ